MESFNILGVSGQETGRSDVGLNMLNLDALSYFVLFFEINQGKVNY